MPCSMHEAIHVVEGNSVPTQCAIISLNVHIVNFERCSLALLGVFKYIWIIYYVIVLVIKAYIYIMFLQSLKGLSDLTGKDVCWVSTLAVWPWWMFSTHKLDGSPQEVQNLLMKSLSSCCILRENPNMWWYQSNIIKLFYITFQITVETTTYLVAFRSFRTISPPIILGKWW